MFYFYLCLSLYQQCLYSAPSKTGDPFDSASLFMNILTLPPKVSISTVVIEKGLRNAMFCSLMGPLMGSPQCRMLISRNCTVAYLCRLFSPMSHVEFKNGLYMSLYFLPPCRMSLKARTHWAHLPSADSRGFKILNMFDRDSRPTLTESVVESADSAVESADYWSRPTGNWSSGYGPLASCHMSNLRIAHAVLSILGVKGHADVTKTFVVM